MKKNILFIILTVASSNIYAGKQTEAKVTKAGLRGDGSLFVEFDKVIEEAGCSDSKFEAESNHPQIDRLLSIALTAAASGREVNVRTNGCIRGAPGFDNTQSSFFYIGKR